MFYLILILLLISITFGVIKFASSRHSKKKLENRQEIIERFRPDIEAAFSEISSFFNYSHYITESERIALVNKYEALATVIQPLLRSNDFKDDTTIESFIRFSNAMSNTSFHKRVNNEHFI